MLGASFFKPKWQHKNPEIRRNALLQLDASSDEGQKIILQLASADPELDIRLLALKRISTISELLGFLASDEPSLSQQALLSLAKRCQQSMTEAELGLLSQLLDATQDESLIELIASKASDSGLRLKALARIEKPSVLSDMVLGNDPLELRLAALQRIDKVSTLQRIVKQSRRKDKAINAQAQAQLDALQQHQQLPAQLQQHANELLANLSAIVKVCQEKQQWQSSVAQVSALQQEWSQIKQQWQALSQPSDLPAQADLQQLFSQHEQQREREAESLQQEQAAYAEDQAVLQQAHSLLQRAQDFKQSCEQLSGDSTADDQDWQACVQQWQALTSPKSQSGSAELAKLRLRFGDVQQSVDSLLSTFSHSQRWRQQANDLLRQLDQRLQKDQLPKSSELGKFKGKWEKIAERAEGLSPSVTQSLREKIEHRLNRLQQSIEEAKQLRKENRGLFQEAVQDLGNALQQGKAKHAVNMLRRCEKLLPQSDIGQREKLFAEFQKLRADTRELQDWRTWSNSPVKERLCAEVETLLQEVRAADQEQLSYAKVKQQLRDYRQEWNTLSNSESHSDRSLTKKFDASCKEIESLCDAFFQQRGELQKNNLAARQAYCDKLAEYAGHLGSIEQGDVDIKALDTIIRTAQSEWRQLGVVSNSDRDDINLRFKDILGKLREVQKAYRQQNREQKQALIERLQTLNQSLDEDESGLTDALELTKRVQAQWKEIGAASKEKTLWQAFQQQANQVFDRLGKQREDQKAQREQQAAQLESIVASVEAAGQQPSLSLAEVNQIQQNGREQWAQVPEAKQFKALQKRFERAIAKLDNSKKEIKASAERERRLAQIRLFARLSELEAQCSQQAALNPDEELQQQCASQPAALAYYQQLLDATQASPPDLSDMRRQLCIEVEVLAGLPSPDQDKEQRMAFQVSMLAEKMKQTDSGNTWQELTELMQKWWQAGCAQYTEALGKRFIAAAEKILASQ